MNQSSARCWLHKIFYPSICGEDLTEPADIVNGLTPLMFTAKTLANLAAAKTFVDDNTSQVPLSTAPFFPSPPSPIPLSFPPSSLPPSSLFVPKFANSLFWCIYVSQHPEEMYPINPGCVEIAVRMEVVNGLKTNPKRLKDTNSKLTLEASNGLLGAMMVAQTDKETFCVAYSVHFNKHILVLNSKTYKLYTPSQSASIEDDADVVILQASSSSGGRKGAQPKYSLDLKSSKEKAMEAMREKVNADMEPVSKYTVAQLNDLKTRLGLGEESKEKLKKQELYDMIRVAIFRDRCANE